MRSMSATGWLIGLKSKNYKMNNSDSSNNNINHSNSNSKSNLIRTRVGLLPTAAENICLRIHITGSPMNNIEDRT